MLLRVPFLLVFCGRSHRARIIGGGEVMNIQINPIKFSKVLAFYH